MNENSPFRIFLKKFIARKTAVVAFMFIIFLLLMAAFGANFAPHDAYLPDYSVTLKGASSTHFFGTDEFGRDIFSRIIVGSRLSLSVALTSVTIAATCGTVLGLISGYVGGLFDNIVMRVCDVMFAFPDIILAIGIVAVLGPGLENVLIAVTIFGIPSFARIMRGAMLELKQSLYVEAARSIGVKSSRIIFVHIFPGAFSTLIVNYTMRIGGAVLSAAGLSFLGLGAKPTDAEWGAMLTAGRTYFTTAPHAVFFPGFAIFLTVLAFNLLGDGLRDALDPKIK
jgi:glutathione transport system permease protein